MEETKIELKMKVKDTVTGYTGTVTGLWTSISSPNKALVEGMDTTNRPIEMWVDVQRLEVVE